MASDFEARIRNVTAVLGPTNTGKTHLAIERMLGHESGMIGLPLRLLAREVYDKIKARVGADAVALVTGEEKIKPERARYWVATVEAMPRDIDVDFLAVDEIQLCGDPERGHVFTDRLLHARGRSETLLLGAQTMREAIGDLIPGANFIARPRLSKLAYSGEKKITRLPPRSAIVAFSAQDVYAIAELIRRQRGGTAVVLGALSPRTRNAQVELYQSGDVEFLVATDAIGMGINLDVDHVAFSAMRKFDGQSHRNLTAGEIGQIAGRAGRYMNDGTFGVTGGCEAPDADMIERLESHTFDPVRVLQWRNRKLDFGSLPRLHDSLRDYPRETRLARARTADDLAALEVLGADPEISSLATSPQLVSKLWDACQVPDYRKISATSHAELIATLYKSIVTGDGHIPEDWFAKQVALADRTDGDIDTLATRIAHIRTWTFVANRPDWLKDPAHWQARTRAIEDSLSDALHECLTQRFVDRRTSALMKGMRDKEELNAEIAEDGSISVEHHFVGKLKGFVFTIDAADDGIHGKATRSAATQVVSRELGMRARRVAAAPNDAFKLTRDARILWRDDQIAKLEAADDPLAPRVTIIADENLSDTDKEKVLTRLQTWVKHLIAEKLKPLADMSAAEDLQGLARGIAFRLKENIGALKRESVASEISALDQAARAELRKYGLRFGAFNIYFPMMLKPAAADLAATLWVLKNSPSAAPEVATALPRPGLTSAPVNAAVPEALYRANGFHVSGPRAVRLDIIERLADQIRPLLAWRQKPDSTDAPPKGSTGDGAFKATDDMMSILGCSVEELGNVLSALGFKLERRPVKTAPIVETTDAKAISVEARTDSLAAVENESSGPVAAEIAAETVTPDIAKAPATAEVDAAAVTYEEIWRPRRHQRGEPRERGKDQRGRRDHRNQSRDAGAKESPAGETLASDPTAAVRAPPSEQRREHGDRDRKDKQRFEKRAHGKFERTGDGRSQDGAPRDNSSRDHSSRDQRRREGGPRRDRNAREEARSRPEVVTAAPPKRAGADPDSPFAALAALKARFDKGTEGQGTP